jgi:hypothetical protein
LKPVERALARWLGIGLWVNSLLVPLRDCLTLHGFLGWVRAESFAVIASSQLGLRRFMFLVAYEMRDQITQAERIIWRII